MKPTTLNTSADSEGSQGPGAGRMLHADWAGACEALPSPCEPVQPSVSRSHFNLDPLAGPAQVASLASIFR